MQFFCQLCNYSTDVKFCYDKHLLTKKHMKKDGKDPKRSFDDPKTIPKPAEVGKIERLHLAREEAAELAVVWGLGGGFEVSGLCCCFVVCVVGLFCVLHEFNGVLA